jgi:hypothetical protein
MLTLILLRIARLSNIYLINMDSTFLAFLRVRAGFGTGFFLISACFLLMEMSVAGFIIFKSIRDLMCWSNSGRQRQTPGARPVLKPGAISPFFCWKILCATALWSDVALGFIVTSTHGDQ